ncbi:MAG: type II and III secretion system protein family protein [Bosea sp. (in: a-proteobacteria)]
MNRSVSLMTRPSLANAIRRRALPGRALYWAAVSAAMLLPLQLAIAEAQAQSGSSSHRITTRSSGSGAQRLDLSIGKSLIVDLPRDAKEVFVANPRVANAVVRSARKLFIIGVADGATSIFAMDGDGQQIAALEISVGRDLNVLRQTLRTALPRAEIEVKPAGDSILLIGHVPNASDASQAMDIAKAFVGVSAGASGASSGAVINSLTIRGRDQVLLKVTIAEVSRQAMKQLGVNVDGSWSSLAANIINPFTVGLSRPDTIVTLGNTSNGAQLRAMERAGVSRILAEPTLTAVSGEAAKFTAGGELPIPSSQSCTPAAFPGGTPICQIGVEYKPYGVSLNFTPIVLSEGRISMRIATEVTEVDVESSRSIGLILVPGFRVRKADTTVEVPSGGTMMTAGLIQQSSRQAINGFPGLLNLPILGALFRSRDYQRNETELLIMVTPYLAKPADPRQIARPDDGFVDAHDAQSILLGRLNKIYGSGKPSAGQGYRGRIGFIAD